MHGEGFGQDLRHAWRGMRRSPGFTVTAVLSLAMGIGATTAVFSVVDRLLFRSLPYVQGERLVSLGISAPMMPYDFLFGALYLNAREHPAAFEAIRSWSGTADCDLTEPGPVRVNCAAVEAGFLETLGIRPAAGRSFSRAEDRADGTRTVLVSHALWQGRLGGAAGAVGRVVMLDGRPARIVGVLPAEFEMPGLEHIDVIVPQGLDDATLRRAVTGRPLHVIARLKPGVSLAQARAAFEAQMEPALAGVPAQIRKELKVRVRSLRDLQVGDARLAAWVLFGAVLAVLGVCCANAANLMLARAASRRRELAIRSALGAARGRLFRQALTESLLLSLIGAAAGAGLAAVLQRVFTAIAPEGIPHLREASLDPRVLCFTLACAVAAGLLFGLAPALERPHPETLTGMRATAVRGWMRQALVAGQISISLALVTAAGLMLRTLWNLENAPLGFRTESVLTASLALTPQRYPDVRRQLAFFEQLEARLRALPGVTNVAIGDSLPPDVPARSQPFFALEAEGRGRLPEGAGGTVVWRAVTPDYFSTLGIPIVRGRAFREEDRRAGEHGVILSQLLARRLFASDDPIGKRVRMGDWYTVIGVAGDVKNSGPATRDDPEYYVARSHDAGNARYNYPDILRRGGVILRSAVRPEALAQMVRSQIAAIDPALPVSLESIEQQVGRLAARPRFNAVLLGLFAAAGLLLAAIGLYGVMAFLVARRTQEIGVRMALGATPAAVTRLILGQAARSIAAGALVGCAASVAVIRVLGSLLFGIQQNDPWNLAVSFTLLLAVTLAAAWFPARRAARVDPMIALHHE